MLHPTSLLHTTTPHSFTPPAHHITSHSHRLCRWSIIAVLVQGVVAAIAQSLIFLMYTVGFAFGGWLMTERLASYDDLYR